MGALETVWCTLCGSSGCQLEIQARDWLYGSGETFNLVRCLNCGLVYLNPRPTVDVIGRYYPRHYYAFQPALSSDPDRIIRPQHLDFARRITAFSGAGYALDVGSGDGSFMLALQSRGWQVSGIEFDGNTARHLREDLKLDVSPGDFMCIALPEAKYDLISMLETLEHLHNPIAALRRAHGLLKPGGVLLLTVPNIESLEYRLFGKDWVALEPPIHLYYFSPRTLRSALEQVGFEIVSLVTSPSTAGLTRSLWLKSRRRLEGPETSVGTYYRRSWRRLMHGVLNKVLWPLGWLLSISGLGPGLEVIARSPGELSNAT